MHTEVPYVQLDFFPAHFSEVSLLSGHQEVNGKSLVCRPFSKKSFNPGYSLKTIAGNRIVIEHILWLLLLGLSGFPLKRYFGMNLPIMAAWAHWDLWKVVMRDSINQFHYFRRLKGKTCSPTVGLVKLECHITLLWGKSYQFHMKTLSTLCWSESLISNCACVWLIKCEIKINEIFCLNIKIVQNTESEKTNLY